MATELRVKTGQYTGDGIDPKVITGLGFAPTFVIIKPADTSANNGAMSWSGIGSDLSFEPSVALAPSANKIQSFDSDGFTIGNDPQVNTSGVLYTWVAMYGTAEYMKQSSYLGTGINPNAITGVGFKPDFIIIKRNGASVGLFSFNSNNQVQQFAAADGSSGIFSIDVDGFTILSTSTSLNASGGTYYYIAIKVPSGGGIQTSYTGNGSDASPLTGLGFQPTVVFIKGLTGSRSPILRTDSHVGDLSTVWVASMADAANLVESLNSDGFTRGTDSKVNTNTAVYHYLALKDTPDSGSSPTSTTRTLVVQPRNLVV